MKEVLLIGNPNTGKTTLFNTLTRGNEHTGNWHGVTVDSKGKKFKIMGEEYTLIDLPGIYSLSALSFEEKVSIDYLFDHPNNLVINIVDINNIYRNLYLTLELIELNVPVILVINETSKIDKAIYQIDEKRLEKELGIKVLKFNAEDKNKVVKLKEEIHSFYHNKNAFNNIEKSEEKNNKNSVINNNDKNTVINKENNYKIIDKIYKNSGFFKEKVQNTLKIIKNNTKKLNLNENFVAFKCLENDGELIKKLNLNESQKQSLNNLQQDIDLAQIAKIKYDAIDNILSEAQVKKNNKVYGKSRADKFVLNKYLALPIFLLIMLAIFYFTFFSFGSFLSEKLSYFVQEIFGSWLLNLIKGITDSVIINDFFASAIVGGLGAIFSFLPQVVILFLCLAILEDSGYLSRVAFSLDDIFSRVGLSGKSVYTLLMGFGCSTSACLTARTMEDKNSKIKTAILAPYMSCSAKLPIYVVIGSAFFGASNVFVIFALYLLGVVVALLLSVFYENTFLKSKEQSFILEFPPYRVTKPKRLLKLAWDNIKQFLIRIGSLLLSVNIIVWVLSSFSFTFGFVMESGGQSMLESLGRILAPIFAPLGFGNWGAVAALLAGLVAKEIIVSSIAMFNGVTSGENMNYNVSRSLTSSASVVFFTPAGAISYMVFCLLYSPCMATFAVLRREVGKKWTYISALVQFVIAYVISLILYTSINLILNRGIWLFLLFFVFVMLLGFSLWFIYKKFSSKKISCSACRYCK